MKRMNFAERETRLEKYKFCDKIYRLQTLMGVTLKCTGMAQLSTFSREQGQNSISGPLKGLKIVIFKFVPILD